MATLTDRSLRVTREFPAARERVFRAWTRADEMRVWSCPEGASVESVASDLRPGGAYHITMRIEDGSLLTARGVYREVEAPSKVVYTWDWDEEDYRMGDTLVTVEFEDLGDRTRIVLTHDFFPAIEARDGHAEGWGSCLDKLERLVA
jgi:uncharacterized protein YndB with AHSA1/START domain